MTEYIDFGLLDLILISLIIVLKNEYRLFRTHWRTEKWIKFDVFSDDTSNGSAKRAYGLILAYSFWFVYKWQWIFRIALKMIVSHDFLVLITMQDTFSLRTVSSFTLYQQSRSYGKLKLKVNHLAWNLGA